MMMCPFFTHTLSHLILCCQVYFLTSKVKRKNAVLRFTEISPSAFDPGPHTGWQLDEHNRLTYHLKKLSVHYQYAAVAVVPPYWDQTISTPRRVRVCLVDTVQGLESNEIDIVYMPTGAASPYGLPPVGSGDAVGGVEGSEEWGVSASAPQLDWFDDDNATAESSSQSSTLHRASDSSSTLGRQSTDLSDAASSPGPPRARVYGSYETSV